MTSIAVPRVLATTGAAPCDQTLWGTPAPTPNEPGHLTPAGRRVWDAFAWFARGTGECWAYIRTIAKRAGVKLRTAQKWLTRLAAWGWIDTRRRGPAPATRTRRHAPCASSCASFAPRTTCLEEGINEPMAHGASARAPGRKAKGLLRRGSLPNLTPMTLRDRQQMHEVLVGLLVAYDDPRAAAKADDPRTLLRWFGTARGCLRTARSPGAAFRWRVAHRRWDMISQEDEDGARADVRHVLGHA